MNGIAGLFPRPEPRPVPGCPSCLPLVRSRHAARERCDLSAVSDANVLLRRHLQEAHGAPRAPSPAGGEAS